jgi:ribosomal protein S18 acetylase RimI-like enzyme
LRLFARGSATQKAFGLIQGGLIYLMMHQQPIPIETHQAYIEDIVTAGDARGKGVATKLITHLMNSLPYDEYTLEVVDTNVNAKKLSEKLGFVVFEKKEQRLFKKQAGFNERIYMQKKL